jgi:hypothetical protein
MSNARRAPLVALLALGLLGTAPQRAAAAPAPEAAPASQPVVPAATPAPTAAPAAVAALPAKLAVGPEKGTFVPGILLQGWFQLDRYTGGDAAAGKDYTTSTFRLRRAEISAKGEIVKGRVGYGVMFDPAKVLEPLGKTYTTAAGDTVTVPTAPKAISVLQDFWVSLLFEYADIALGQFKVPVSWEGLNSSSALLFPERSLVAVKWGDKRDLGIKVTKTFKYFGYYVGLFNGQQLNNLDVNNSKDLTARLEAYPIKGLTLAGVVYNELKASSTVYKKRRYEADLRFERWGFLFQGEYIYGVDQAPTDSAAKTGQGFYAALAYGFLGGRLQPAFRLGLIDPDLDKGKNYTMHYDVGVNYYLLKNHAKVQLAYGRLQETSDSGKKSTNELILALQGHY